MKKIIKTIKEKLQKIEKSKFNLFLIIFTFLFFYIVNIGISYVFVQITDALVTQSDITLHHELRLRSLEGEDYSDLCNLLTTTTQKCQKKKNNQKQK